MNDRWYYTPQEVGERLSWDPQYIRHMARTEPRKLPFATLTHGTRVQIPKASFDEWFSGLAGRVG